MKRTVDIVLCILGLPVLLPVLLLSGLAIFLDTGRPIFFTQKRIGKGGRLIRIIKFRTLLTNLGENHGHTIMKAYVRGEVGQNASGKEVFKAVTAKQITRVGGFLRRTSLDELPQLINVLKGEMSIVGPRPNVPWEVDEYRPWHHERLEVLPGITGLAQVRGRSSISFDSIARHDIHYIENQSLGMDLKIIWWTIQSVVRRSGAG
jgi:lipopolysaccharide/colanic/teichoic acid biosynthesis glycosyltransferase